MRKLYQPEQGNITLSGLFYALSDPTRLQICRLLQQRTEICCGSFGLPLAKSTLSHHLKVMREAGMLETRIEGTQRFVSLREKDLELRFSGLLKIIQEATEPL